MEWLWSWFFALLAALGLQNPAPPDTSRGRAPGCCWEMGLRG